MGYTGDNATAGVWGRMDPVGTYTTGGAICQPELDHTPGTGVNCFVTDGRAGSSINTYDVDGGRTSLVSPTWDLSAYQSAYLDLWSWYSNDLGNNPSTDSLHLMLSSDGGTTWTNIMYTNAHWEYWKEDLLNLGSYITLTSQVKLRIIAADVGTTATVEAAVDDICVYGMGPQPQTPANLVAVIDEADVHLYWQAAANAGGYRIEVASTPNGTYSTLATVGSAQTDYLHLNGTVSGVVAFYRVVAIR